MIEKKETQAQKSYGEHMCVIKSAYILNKRQIIFISVC